MAAVGRGKHGDTDEEGGAVRAGAVGAGWVTRTGLDSTMGGGREGK
eukprot:CAMPEP_0169448606 /NCGR_PEP_ID=MMETSP1042-20121227/12145_1 /TAXON_ID=464988 /ORGANISM="Hemiselmis andersenii, Strain CCMP1180" /LENGTH=45 /DNA_ID= /DNA_START= /DNA_END= /DNA_ORIENTATION=